MPSERFAVSLRERVLTEQNVAILVAVVVAIPAAYLFAWQFDTQAGNFLLLAAIGVGVPSIYGTSFEGAGRNVVLLVALLAAVAAASFTAIYLAGVAWLSIPPTFAALLAYLVTELGPRAVLAARGDEATSE
ncbi:MAG: hypothetical protein ABEJ89_04835 [Haloarculaceae archaeon]